MPIETNVTHVLLISVTDEPAVAVAITSNQTEDGLAAMYEAIYGPYYKITVFPICNRQNVEQVTLTFRGDYD